MALTWMEPLVNWLSVYVYRGVPLLSLSMHLILATFSESRRREDRGWKRLLVWVAYQLTDWGPAYVIGNLYLETSPREKMIIAFWVPFLLLHHARPDNISAYTIEDSELWIRLMVSVLPKSVGSICIVYRFILTDCAADWLLRWASGIMLFLGIWKYLESAAALWLSNLAHIRDLRWLSKKQIDLSVLKDDDEEATDDEALLVAHDLFEICKGAFCDYTVGVAHEAVTTMFSGRWESMCMVVEMELSLMYDILYTKAAVVHTWHGYAIRLASPPLTATALLLFVLHCKEGMEPVDKAISYILLSTTFLLDVRWLFRALASSWTHSYFKHRPHSWLKHEVWCQERWKKLRGFVMSLCLSRLSLWLWACECGKERPFRNKCGKKPKSYRRWAGTFGQCNLLDQCAIGNRHNLHSIPSGLAIESGHQLRSRGTEIPDYVKKLVFSNICGILFPEPVVNTDTQQTTNNDNPGPPGPRNPPTDDPKGSGGHATPKALGPSGPGNPPTGPMDPGGHEGTVTTSWLPGPGSPSQGTGSAGSKHPIGTVARWLPPGELPDHYTGAYDPVSPDPDNRCLGPLYPTERICNGIDGQHPLWLHYPGSRGWMCTGVGVQAAPWPLYPREQISISINNEPLRLPYPWEVHADAGMENAPIEEHRYNAPSEEHMYNAPARPYGHPEEQAAEDHWRYGYEQAQAGMRNAPFEENRYDAPARPYGHLEERAAEGHWRYDYGEQVPSEAYEQAEHRVYGVNRQVHRQDTPNTYVQGDGQAKANTVKTNKPMESDEDMWFPPELQEVILIWHIATDVFLSCITGEGEYKEVPSGESIELGKAIEQMSDYMMFLVAKRSEMLPGLKLSSLYENAQGALKRVQDIKAASEGHKQYTSYARNEKEELAKWMPENMDRLKDPDKWMPENMDRLKGPDTDIIWEGTQLARVLLRQVPQDVQPKWSVTAGEVTVTEKKFECWVPDLKLLTPRSMKDMLDFILNAWVRLLLYASMRCSRDSHAKRLSQGGELTTLVWIITEHAKISFVKQQLPLLFPQEVKTQPQKEKAH